MGEHLKLVWAEFSTELGCFDDVQVLIYMDHRYRKAKVDCLRFVMCPLLAQLEIGFFSSFSAAAVYSTNEANKAGLKQSIIFRCL